MFQKLLCLCFFTTILIPNSLDASEPAVSIFGSFEKTLKFRGEVISVELPDLFEGKEYQIDLKLINNLEGPFFVGNIFTSCGCTAATASAGTPIDPQSFLNVKITLENLSAPVLNSTINVVGRDDTDLVAQINIKGKVHSPFQIVFPEDAIRDDMSEGQLPVTIRSTLDEIDLSECKITAFGVWIDSFDVIARSKNEIQGMLNLAISKSDYDSYSELIFRLSTSSFRASEVIELSTSLRRKVPLSIRPQNLLIPRLNGEPFTLKAIITGDFAIETPYTIEASIEEKSFFSSKVNPRTEKMMLLSFEIPSELVSHKSGQITISINEKQLVLPFKLDSE